MPMPYTPADGSGSNTEFMKKDANFFIKSMKKLLPIPLRRLPYFGPGTASISWVDIPRPFRSWEASFKNIRLGSGDPRLNT